MKKTIITFLTVGVFIFLGTTKIFACSCMIPDEPKIALEGSTSVFIGTVLDINEKKSFNSMDKYEIKLSGIKNIKGESSDIKTVYTSQSSASCGFNFENGKEYIVYTYGEKNDEEVSLCSRTSETQYALDDLEYFKEKINTENSGNNGVLVINNTKKISEVYLPIILILISVIIVMFGTKGLNKKL